MRWVWAAVGVAVAGGVTAWVTWLKRRQDHWLGALSDAIPVHSKYWRERAKLPGAPLYVALGDSAAQGIGASAPQRSYVGELAKRIRKESGADWRVVNRSVSGATIGLLLRDQLPKIAKLTPDLMTVAIGANDIAAYEPERFDREIRQLYAVLPGHAIVADLPCFYFGRRDRMAREANGLLRAAAAERGLTVVPLYDLTRKQGLWGVITQFAGDLFHPNDRGYAVWAAAFAPAVDARLVELARRSSPAD